LGGGAWSSLQIQIFQPDGQGFVKWIESVTRTHREGLHIRANACRINGQCTVAHGCRRAGIGRKSPCGRIQIIAFKVIFEGRDRCHRIRPKGDGDGINFRNRRIRNRWSVIDAGHKTRHRRIVDDDSRFYEICKGATNGRVVIGDNHIKRLREDVRESGPFNGDRPCRVCPV